MIILSNRHSISFVAIHYIVQFLPLLIDSVFSVIDLPIQVLQGISQCFRRTIGIGSSLYTSSDSIIQQLASIATE